MKTILMISAILLSFSALASDTESTSSHQQSYQAGISQLDAGRLQAASDSFYDSIRQAPTPATEPGDYLPYLYLSITSFEMGHTREARDALIQSQVFGTAAKTDTGRQLLDRYAANIMSAPLDETRFVMPSQSAELKPLAVVAATEEAGTATLTSASDTEIFQTADDTFMGKSSLLKRCVASTRQGTSDDLPWFFHYQCGVELMKSGDAQSAIDSFLMGAKDLEDSSRGKRMYGMWFIDYLPHYQIALAHSKLGEWESANAAIKTSQTAGEFSPSDPDYESFTDLDRLIKSHLKSSGS